MGRPTIYSEAIADEICDRLVAGESLRRICRRAAMPGASTVFRWLADDANAAFRERYTLAREAQADTLADEAVYIADTPKMGVEVTTKEVIITVGEAEIPAIEKKTKRGDMLGHRRLQVDARKWFAAKLNPRKYGDRLELGGAVAIKGISAEPLSEEEWAAKHAPSPANDPPQG
jgi:hypothetical protein